MSSVDKVERWRGVLCVREISVGGRAGRHLGRAAGRSVVERTSSTSKSTNNRRLLFTPLRFVMKLNLRAFCVAVLAGGCKAILAINLYLSVNVDRNVSNYASIFCVNRLIDKANS